MRVQYYNLFYNILHRNQLHIKPCRKLHSYPDLRIEFLCNPDNILSISENILKRKGVGDIKRVQNLYTQLKSTSKGNDEYKGMEEEFYMEASKIPNETHPVVLNYNDQPKIVTILGAKPEYSYKPKQFHNITKDLNLMRTTQLGNVAGNRSYYFVGALAELEEALIRYTLGKLLKLGFRLLSVPDILPASVIESCGMCTKGERTQVYFLNSAHGDDLCLSGTAEMAIAGYFKNKIISSNNLPVKVASVSRCYRAETSSTAEERGIYRVHQFTKIEMFAVTKPEDSNKTLEDFREFQEQHFSSLGFHLQTLDMPPCELGSPAYRKYDVEAWLPGRNIFGELSSCSNCTDYQARRLHIKYETENGGREFVHTVNGTACAVPRMLISLLEYHQNEDGSVNIPDCLRPYLRFNKIGKQFNIPELKLKKIKR